MPEPSRPTVVRDPEAWRQLAHRTRRLVLIELCSRGDSRVADLAAAVGEPANAVSFHLRTLERYGYVERVSAPGGDGRERWWRATNVSGFSSGSEELGGDGNALSAVQDVARSMEADLHAFVASWFHANDHEQPLAPMNGELRLRLTAAERQQLGDELGTVLRGWAVRSRGAAPVDDDGSPRFDFALVTLGMTDGRR